MVGSGSIFNNSRDKVLDKGQGTFRVRFLIPIYDSRVVEESRTGMSRDSKSPVIAVPN